MFISCGHSTSPRLVMHVVYLMDKDVIRTAIWHSTSDQGCGGQKSTQATQNKAKYKTG